MKGTTHNKWKIATIFLAITTLCSMFLAVTMAYKADRHAEESAELDTQLTDCQLIHATNPDNE